MEEVKLNGHTWRDYMDRAREIIRRAELDLGPLNAGQRRDLLADNTPHTLETIDELVACIAAQVGERG